MQGFGNAAEILEEKKENAKKVRANIDKLMSYLVWWLRSSPSWPARCLWMFTPALSNDERGINAEVKQLEQVIGDCQKAIDAEASKLESSSRERREAATRGLDALEAEISDCEKGLAALPYERGKYQQRMKEVEAHGTGRP
jgi:DNA mismatch repair ATPase MutS